MSNYHILSAAKSSFKTDLHQLEGPDGCEEVLLRLVAVHVLLQSLRALRELKIFPNNKKSVLQIFPNDNMKFVPMIYKALCCKT